MCISCWSTARNAASAAESALRGAAEYFQTPQGQEEPEGYAEEVTGARTALMSSIARLDGCRAREDGTRRAIQADVDALLLARAAMLRMSDTDANLVRPYRHFGESQLDVWRAVEKIQATWAADPDVHPAEPPVEEDSRLAAAEDEPADQT